MPTRDPAPDKAAFRNSSAPANLEEIRKLIDLAIEKGVSELEIERPGLRIRIARQRGVRAVDVPIPAHDDVPRAGAAAAPPAPARGAASKASAEAAGRAPALEELFVVRSPMVGTFYAASSPEAEPFVLVGDRVAAGQVLCIIEAMKLMNEIEAEIAGEVVKCYVDAGQPVEYGEPLFDLRPLTPLKTPLKR
jgi:acetyl-CoA carboxylase biotin carboxyl carrier protein